MTPTAESQLTVGNNLKQTEVIIMFHRTSLLMTASQMAMIMNLDNQLSCIRLRPFEKTATFRFLHNIKKQHIML